MKVILYVWSMNIRQLVGIILMKMGEANWNTKNTQKNTDGFFVNINYNLVILWLVDQLWLVTYYLLMTGEVLLLVIFCDVLLLVMFCKMTFCYWWRSVRWRSVRGHFVRWHFVRWHFVRWLPPPPALNRGVEARAGRLSVWLLRATAQTELQGGGVPVEWQMWNAWQAK